MELMEPYEKFINMVSDYTLQLIFKKLPLTEFQCSVKKKKIVLGKGIPGREDKKEVDVLDDGRKASD